MPLVPLSRPKRIAELVLGRLLELGGSPGADRSCGVGQILLSRSLSCKNIDGAAGVMVNAVMHEANGIKSAVDANGSAKAHKMENVAPADKGKFLEVYRQLKAELLRDSNFFTYTSDSREWVGKMLDYTVPGGKLNRGLSVVDTLALLKKRQLTDQEFFLASALGWCIEWLQAYFLIEDDIMDNSVTRRGQLCWYRVPKVGMIAVNDGIVLRNHIHQILKRHFRGLPCYTDLLDLYNEVEYQTAFGQTLDLITTPDGEVDLSKYVTSTWEKIVKYKTAYYTFYLPVASALLLAGEKDDKVYRISEDILIQMGTYFQAQDDFLDCYGDPEVIGKIGTDIEDTKCSWLVVKALETASPEQKQRLKDIYGQKDPEKVKEVKAIYNNLNLKRAFEEYEEASHKQIIKEIESQASPSLQAVLKTFLGKIYKRQK